MGRWMLSAIFSLIAAPGKIESGIFWLTFPRYVRVYVSNGEHLRVQNSFTTTTINNNENRIVIMMIISRINEHLKITNI